MTQAVAGSLASDSRGQTFIDLILFDDFDPYRTARPGRDIEEGMQAVGVLNDVYHRSSKQVPGLVLEAPHSRRHTEVLTDRGWTIWGQRGRAARGLSIAPHGTERPDNSIAHEVEDSMRYVLVELAISDLLQQMLEGQAAARDVARRLHGSLRRRNLTTLRNSVLTLSLDIATIVRDLAAHRARRWQYGEEADFDMDIRPWEVRADRAAGRKRFKKQNFSTYLRDRFDSQATELADADRELRAILTTAASLNSSLDSRSAQRIALVVSAASLMVALVALVGFPKLVALGQQVWAALTGLFV